MYIYKYMYIYIYVCVYVYTVVCLPGSLFDFISYATLKQKTTLQNYF